MVSFVHFTATTSKAWVAFIQLPQVSASELSWLSC